MTIWWRLPARPAYLTNGAADNMLRAAVETLDHIGTQGERYRQEYIPPMFGSDFQSAQRLRVTRW